MNALADAIRDFARARYLAAPREVREAVIRSDPRVRAMLIAQGKVEPTPSERDDFPKPGRRDSKGPCGECHLNPGETCDICGAALPAKAAS